MVRGGSLIADLDLPVVDVTDSRRVWAPAVGEAFHKHAGFCLLRPSDKLLDLYEDMFELWTAFTELEDATRRKYQAPKVGGEVGFNPMYTEKNRLKGEETSQDEGNPNRYYMIGRDASNAPSQIRDMLCRTPFPDDELSGFRNTAEKLYTRLDQLAQDILYGLTMYAEQEVGEKLAPTFDSHARHGNTILRLLDYPERDEVNPDESRIGAHEDRGLITLLKTDGVGGLEVLAGDNPRKKDHWASVDNDPEELVINIGEAMARLVNDFYPATKHRVVSTSTERRQSMPFFVHASPGDVLQPMQPFIVDRGLNPEWNGVVHMDDYILRNINKRRRDGYNLPYLREKEFAALNQEAWKDGAHVYHTD